MATLKEINAYAGDQPANGGSLLNNRTGVTTVIGQVGFLDIAQTQAESTDVLSALSDVTPPTTALLAVGKAVVALEIIADNAQGRFAQDYGNIVDLSVNSTTDIAKLDPLKVVNGQNYAVKATAGTDRYIAIALEARTSNDVGTIKALLIPFGTI